MLDSRLTSSLKLRKFKLSSLRRRHVLPTLKVFENEFVHVFFNLIHHDGIGRKSKR